METNSKYLEASFISFFIHAIIILSMLGVFYKESTERSIISKPINVNLIFEQLAVAPKESVSKSKNKIQTSKLND